MAAPALTKSDFFDADTFGLDWANKYVMLGRSMGMKKDNGGRAVSLPAGSIGYVAQATPGSILVVFGTDPRKAPEPTSEVYTVSHRRYPAVFTFVWSDWRSLNLLRTR